MDFSDIGVVLQNIEFIAEGNEGGVMKCEIDNISLPMAIKMHFNYGQPTKTYMKLCVEAGILKEIPKHPNIIFLLHDFFSRPTHEMVSACIEDKEIRGMMIKEFNAISAKNEYRTSLFLMYKSYPSNLQLWSLEKRKDCQMIDLIRICYEISCGVLHLWNHGFVHRDLKLNNILIDDEGHILIIDFGMAVKLNSNGKFFVDFPGGNHAHLAPEILNSDFPGEVDYSKQPSFALGVLFHEIIMGSHPFGNYPLGGFGRKPNIYVPALNSENMNQIKNPVIDEKLISMIENLVFSSSSDRMSLKNANNILKNLFWKYSHFHDLFIYNSYSDLHLKSNQNIVSNQKENFGLNFTNIGFFLGCCYRDGKGTGKDESQAFKYFQLSSDQNDSYAQHNLGDCYENGIGTEKDEFQAFKYFQLSSDQNNSYAQNRLGLCYLNGIGTEKDESQAFKYFQLSSDQNNSEGQNSLGYCYQYGIGTEKDESQAFKYFQLSSDQNNSGAQHNLGYCYENGIGTKKDESQAFKYYFQLSSDQNNSYGQHRLGLCYEYGRGTEKDKSQAFKYFQLSSDQNNSDGQNRLGLCYLYGIGTKKDESQAFKYFQLSSDQNNSNDLIEFITVNQPSFSELKEHGILYENCCKKYLNENGFNPSDVAIEPFENQIFLVTKTRQLFYDIFPQLRFTRERLTIKVSPICKNLIDVSQDKKKPEFLNEFNSCMEFDYQKDELKIVVTSYLAPEIKNFDKKYSTWENKQKEENTKNSWFRKFL